jgi:hypothetical protein
MSDPNVGWRESLPEELRDSPALKDFKDPAALAKSYLETKHLVGSSIRPPGPDAGPEAHAEFAKKLGEKSPGIVYIPEDEAARAAVESSIWDRLGRPADESGYIAVVEDVTVDLPALKAQAKAEGLTKAQFAKRLEKVVTEARAAQESRKAAETALKAEWGSAYEERVLQAKTVAMRLGVPEAALASIPPAQLKVWANVAKSIGGEGRQVATQPANPTGAMGKEEMQLQVAEMRGRKEYLNASVNPALTAQLRRKVMEYEKALSEG